MTQARLAAAVRTLRGALAERDAAGQGDAELLHAFAARRDPAAFAELVRRHGPMVLGVCRRQLGNEHDAEDAFQATFLVLARKAGSVRRAGALGCWLHGVSYRIAMRAKREAARRRARETTKVRPVPPADPAQDLAWREVKAALDEEVQALPPIYRAAFVLCCL
ncbi:MAG TPA: RNA polymerase sigma factor, partial [Gemmataceae bacterium]